jgi:hypothetical protein
MALFANHGKLEVADEPKERKTHPFRGFAAAFFCGSVLTAVPLFAMLESSVQHYQNRAVQGGAADFDPDHNFYWLRVNRLR